MIKNSTHKLSNVSYFEISFNGSASIEPKGYKGITHIIEHCMCENIKINEQKYKNYALTWNAYTGSNIMTFYISGLSKYIDKVKNEFTDAILNYQIERDVFERERNIIITEYYQHYSDQSSAFMFNLSRKLYNSCGPIGYIEDLKNLTYEQFIEYKNKFYSKPSYIGFVHSKKSKDLSNKELNNLSFNNIKKYEDKIEIGNYTDYPMESYSNFDAQRIIFMSNIIPNDKDLNNKCYSKIFASCISGGLTSPLYQELREKLQCVYSLYSSLDKLSNTQLQFYTFVYCDAAKYQLVLEKLQETIKNIKSFIHKKDFNNALNGIKNKIKLSNITSYQNNNVFSEDYTKIYNKFMSKDLTYKGFIEFINMFLNSDISYFVDNEFNGEK